MFASSLSSSNGNSSTRGERSIGGSSQDGTCIQMEDNRKEKKNREEQK